MLSGVGGPRLTHYVGLLSDAPSILVAMIIAITTSRRARSEALRRAWCSLAVALGLYWIGTLITVQSWLHDQDPFPGFGDLFFLAFYAAMLVAAVQLMPGRFISVAEDCGQIIKLGRWVLIEACRALVVWRACVAGGKDLRVAVNISGRHLQHGEILRDVGDALAMSGLEPSNLVIELTESTIMSNTEANLERLQRLKALGVRIALDDFGTGYSSLSYLHRFPIDILKIDRSFVSRLTTSGTGPELARAVITLGSTWSSPTAPASPDATSFGPPPLRRRASPRLAASPRSL